MSSKYEGIFIRDTLKDTGMIPSVTGSPTYSPDVICYQEETLSIDDAIATYGQYICQKFKQNHPNNIYVRVKNNADKALAGKVKVFYAPITLLYTPNFWMPILTSDGEQEVSLICKSSSDQVNAGEIGLCAKAFRLDAVEKPKEHHCMMGIVSNENGSFIKIPDKFNGDSDLWEFLRNNPQIAYNNITIVNQVPDTLSLPVQYGNHDDTVRKFVLNIDIMDGLNTLEGAQIIVSSANGTHPFTYCETIQKDVSSYSCEYTVDGCFYDYMDFKIIMPNHDKIKADLHIINYAVNKNSDIMTPDIAVDYTGESATADNDTTATQLGDFFLYLGDDSNGITAHALHRENTDGLPHVEVTQRF